jgi:hypothetical protein
LVAQVSDIIKRLTENAHVLEAHRYTAAAATMREAAEIITVLRANDADLQSELRRGATTIALMVQPRMEQ